MAATSSTVRLATRPAQGLSKVCRDFAMHVIWLVKRLSAAVHSTKHVHDQGGRGADRAERPGPPGVGAAVRRRLPEPNARRVPRLRRGRARAAAIDAAVGGGRLVAERRRCRHRDRRGQPPPGGPPATANLPYRPDDHPAGLVERLHRCLGDASTAGGSRPRSTTCSRVAHSSVSSTTMLVPALRALGDAWAAGRVTVAGEHLASNAILRRLAAAFQASGTTSWRNDLSGP